MMYLGVKEEEIISYDSARMCRSIIITCIGGFSLMEIVSYFVYLTKVFCIFQSSYVSMQNYSFIPG